MRKFPGMAALSALGLLLSGTAVAAPAGPKEKLRPTGKPKMIVIAHRGCWDVAPEVSVASIEACVGTGIDGVEIDIQKTRDGAYVLIHDKTVDRTTDGTGKVAEMTLAELKALRLRAGAGGADAPLTDERIPTFEEGLLAAKKAGFIVHLDYKAVSLADMAPVIRKLGMEQQVTGWIRGKATDATMPDPAVGEVIALSPIIWECKPDAATCRSDPPEALEGYDRFKPWGYFLNIYQTRAFVRRFAEAKRPANTQITTETLGVIDRLPPAQRRGQWGALADLGVTMILTDHPKDLVAYLKKSRRR